MSVSNVVKTSDMCFVELSIERSGSDVKKFGTRAGIRIFVLQCSHNFKTNAAETTGKQEAKLFESNALSEHLLIYTKCG